MTKTESNRRERQENKLDFLLFILTFLPGDLGATTELLCGRSSIPLAD